MYGDEVWERLNDSKVNDFIQIHTYDEEMRPEANADIIAGYCSENKRYGKPIVVTEFASKNITHNEPISCAKAFWLRRKKSVLHGCMLLFGIAMPSSEWDMGI